MAKSINSACDLHPALRLQERRAGGVAADVGVPADVEVAAEDRGVAENN